MDLDERDQTTMTEPTEQVPDFDEPTVVHVNGEEVFDFTLVRKEIKFKLGADYFYAVPDMPGLTGIEFGAKMEQISNGTPDEQPKIIEEIFRMILKPDSADRFVERLRSNENPIGVRPMNNVMNWLMTQYGMRPTEPSEESSDGS